jgi:starch synthase
MSVNPSDRVPSTSVLIVGSEAQPFSKTGGLADVLGALPPAISRLGWDVTLVTPRYKGVAAGNLADRFSLIVGGRRVDLGLFEAPLAGGGRAILVDAPELYDRDGIYGVGTHDYPDSPRRYGVLARAALEFAARQSPRRWLVHAHDWQAGLVPVYLKTLYAGHAHLATTPVVFTIHNLAYQGICERDWLPRLDLPWDLLTPERLEFWGKVSFLKGGITDSHVITTVSPTYACEIQTPELGFGFDGVLRGRANDLMGILNGIDTGVWNPAADPYLPAAFDVDRLDRKQASKRALLERFGLPAGSAQPARPLVGMISRMVDQKGFDLIEALSSELVALDADFVVLGTGEERYQNMWKGLAASHPQQVGVTIGFDEALAHLIEAGADMFLMPSRFEPCGLNQMYSLRYGTVPIVRRVGGLADTVEDGRNGLTFDEYTPSALLQTLRRALIVFKNHEKWRAMQVAGMREDHSWDRSALEYVTIYEQLLAAHWGWLGG